MASESVGSGIDNQELISDYWGRYRQLSLVVSNPDSGQFLEDKLNSDDSPDISSRNQRRRKGDGSGCIYHRMVVKKGKRYQESYYQYEFWENGSCLIKSSKYIPKGKLTEVQRLDARKAPVKEILELLGVEEYC